MQRVEHARRLLLLAEQVGQSQARQEEQRREHGRGARQERRRATRTEHGARRAGAKARAGIGALATLQQYEAHDREREQHVKDDGESLQPVHAKETLSALRRNPCVNLRRRRSARTRPP